MGMWRSLHPFHPSSPRPNRKRGSKRSDRSRGERARTARRELQLERFEERILLTAAPQLLSILANNGDVVYSPSVTTQPLSTAPNELDFLFNEGQSIDPSTLSGIQIVPRGNRPHAEHCGRRADSARLCRHRLHLQPGGRPFRFHAARRPLPDHHSRQGAGSAYEYQRSGFGIQQRRRPARQFPVGHGASSAVGRSRACHAQRSRRAAAGRQHDRRVFQQADPAASADRQSARSASVPVGRHAEHGGSGGRFRLHARQRELQHVHQYGAVDLRRTAQPDGLRGVPAADRQQPGCRHRQQFRSGNRLRPGGSSGLDVWRCQHALAGSRTEQSGRPERDAAPDSLGPRHGHRPGGRQSRDRISGRQRRTGRPQYPHRTERRYGRSAAAGRYAVRSDDHVQLPQRLRQHGR